MTSTCFITAGFSTSFGVTTCFTEFEDFFHELHLRRLLFLLDVMSRPTTAAFFQWYTSYVDHYVSISPPLHHGFTCGGSSLGTGDLQEHLPQGRRTSHTWELHHLVHGDHYGWIQSFGITYFQDQGSSLWDWLHSRWSTWRPLRQGQPISGKDYMCQLHALHGYWRHSSCLYKEYPTWNLTSK